MYCIMMHLLVPNSLCVCLEKKSSPFQFLTFFFSFRQITEAETTAGAKAHNSLCFHHSSHFQHMFPNHFTSVMLFNPYNAFVGKPYGSCLIDGETEGLHDLTCVTWLPEGRLWMWIPTCPLRFISLSTIAQLLVLKCKERDAGTGRSTSVCVQQGHVSTLGMGLTPKG